MKEKISLKIFMIRLLIMIYVSLKEFICNSKLKTFKIDIHVAYLELFIVLLFYIFVFDLTT